MSVSVYHVSVLCKDGSMKGFEVPMEVYYYVLQLEACIKHPNESKLKEKYPDRFH